MNLGGNRKTTEPPSRATGEAFADAMAASEKVQANGDGADRTNIAIHLGMLFLIWVVHGGPVMSCLRMRKKRNELESNVELPSLVRLKLSMMNSPLSQSGQL